jgi:adenylate kinase
MNSVKRRIYCILGGPCTGKGTQCNILRKDHGIICISAGDLLREKYPIGTDQRALLDAGNLVSLEIINDIMSEKIIEHNFDLILDGYPRTKEQSQFLKKFLEDHDLNLSGIILLKTHKEILINRMMSRFYCNNCNLTYSKSTKCCDKITITRSDDNENVFLKRLNIWENSLENVLNIFDCPKYMIDVNKNVEEISKEILFYLDL